MRAGIMLALIASASAVPLARRTLPTIPTDFDARDLFACRAFEPRSQGTCKYGAVYAAATALGTRMCIGYGQNNSLTNTVLSVQKACSASAVVAAQFLVTNATTDDGGNGAYQATAVANVSSGLYQYELMALGPGIVHFDVYSDFAAYKAGIYSVGTGATLVTAAHSLTLVGWGVDTGVAYWLVQNSYGAWWGENGYARIQRNTNVGNIEKYGMVSIQAAAPRKCPNACPINTYTLNDCSCSPCLNQWTGPSCSVCPRCQNGGSMLSNCTCMCPRTISGPLCDVNPRINLSAPVVAQLQPQGYPTIINFSVSGSLLKTAPTTLCYNIPEYLNAPNKMVGLLYQYHALAPGVEPGFIPFSAPASANACFTFVVGLCFGGPNFIWIPCSDFMYAFQITANGQTLLQTNWFTVRSY